MRSALAAKSSIIHVLVLVLVIISGL